MKHVELTCGFAAAFLGVLALGVQFFIPIVLYHGVTTRGSVILSFSGRASIEQTIGLAATLLYLALFGLPLAGVALGSFLDTQKKSLPGKLLLWISTLALLALVGLSLASIGIFLTPTLALALITSLFALPILKF